MVLMNTLIQEITMGPFGSDIKIDNFIDDGVPVLNGSNVNEVKLTEDSFKYISKEKAKSLKKANTKRGDIVITHRGTLGQIAYIPKNSKYDNYIISQSQFRVTLKKNLVDPVYFTYYFHTSEGQKRLLSFKNHVGVPALAQATTNFRLLEFPYKSIQTQKQIAKVLSDLDAKIEVNNKINQELEVMAKTLYDYWFVQFDFPDAHGKPYKSSGGKMVFNEELKREIPEGWEVLDLDKVENNIVTGKTPSTTVSEYFNGGIPFICIGDVRGNMHVTNTEITLTELGANTQFNKFIPKGSICVTCIASPGLVAFATKNSQTNQQLNSIVCKNSENKYFLYFYLKDYFKFSSAKTGNTFANMNKSDFSSIKVRKPKKEVLVNFSNILDSTIEKILNNSLENQELTSLRDWLLPMLMNGEVRVAHSQADGYLGEVEQGLGMVAEPGAAYEKDKESIDSLFDAINYDYEVAVVVLLTRQRMDRTYGKKYIHKMFSNIKFLEDLPIFEDLKFQENHWGMYCPTLTKTIDNQKFIYFEGVNDEVSVINFKYKHIKEVLDWMKQDDYNKNFVNQINNMLSIYEKPLINKNMDRIELLNTVLECMNVLETDNFDIIWNKMERWKMQEDNYKTKAEKFKPEETRMMIDFIQGLK